MKVLIVYKSFLGSTETYANWLAEEVGGEARRWGKVGKEDLTKCDVIVVSSGTYAGWMPLSGYLKKKWDVIKDKNVVVVAVGAAPADDQWSVQSYEKIPKDIRKGIEYYKIPGKAGEDKSRIKKENLDPIVQYIAGLRKKKK